MAKTQASRLVRLDTSKPEITNMTAPTTLVASGGAVTITVTVKNIGDDPGTFTVRLYRNSVEQSSQSTGSLAVNASITLTFATTQDSRDSTFTAVVE